MSSEQADQLRIAAAIAQAGCYVLGCERSRFIAPAYNLNSCESLHVAAMGEAACVLGVSYSARSKCFVFIPCYVSHSKCPWFKTMVEFYTEAGEKAKGGES